MLVVSMTSGRLQCSVKRMHFLNTTKGLKDLTLQHFEAQSYFAFLFLLPSTVAFLFKSICVLFSQIGYLKAFCTII